MMCDIQKAAQLIKEANNILIMPHRDPDGDALGSAYALKTAIAKLEKKVFVLCDDKLPQKYAFLAEGHLVMPSNFEPEFVITVDTAQESLLGKRAESFGGRVDLCIDHHVSNSMYAKHTLLDDKAAATGEVIFKLVDALGSTITKNMARDMYTAIICDTGCFKYPNTTQNTLAVVSELLKLDFNFAKVARTMFDVKTRGQMELEKRVLETLEYYQNGKVAMMTVSRDVLRQTGTSEEDLDGLVQLPRQIEGVVVGVTLKQQKDDEYRISMRSNFVIDVSQVCAVMGGGGHIRAAGCSLRGSEAQVKEHILQVLDTFFRSVGDV